jgi:hypothetical protein
MSGLVGFIVYLGMQNVNKLEQQYNPLKGTPHRPSPDVVRPGSITRLRIDTNNTKQKPYYCNYPIESVHFIKPVDKIIRRGDGMPVFIYCESNWWRRWRNYIKGVMPPRIKVTGFIENGIICDEENTSLIRVELDLYPKQLTPGTPDSQI